MIKKTPAFWYRSLGWRALLLLPLSLLFALGRRIYNGFYAHPWKAPLPIICVGNFIAGGAGKTPVARALAQLLQTQKKVHFLTRGYKGKEKGPILVKNEHHSFKEVGDEALLLSQDASTWVARQRQQGIQAAFDQGAEVIIMDDGLQDPKVKKNLCFVVIDQQMAFGNGCLLPSGPLRQLPSQGFKQVDAAIIIQQHDSDQEECFNFQQRLLKNAPLSLPYFTAKAEISNIGDIPQGPLIAFAGIGYPEKFFSLLKKEGFTLLTTVTFPDHHCYSEQELTNLCQEAKRQRATLLTTEKDYVRLPSAYKQVIIAVKMHLQWQDPAALTHFMYQFL